MTNPSSDVLERAARVREFIGLRKRIVSPSADGEQQLIADLEAILATIERLSAELEWQPIETAPQDGRFVLLRCPPGQLESGEVTIGAYWKHDERAENGRFRKGNWGGWLGMDVDIASSWCDPTHWRPLPDPPTDAALTLPQTNYERSQSVESGGK